MIQDIEKGSFNNQYFDYEITENDFVLAFAGKNVLLIDEEIPTLKQYREVEQTDKFYYLFIVANKRYFLACEYNKEKNDSYVPLMAARGKGYTNEMMLAVATGYHLFMWYRNNQYCGRCTKKMIHHKSLRSLKCECGNQIFPSIFPAVIVAVTDKDKIVLTKYANREYTRFALIAGFCEIGESVEQTVAREVKEEVGLDVKNIRYYKSQPWGFDGDLLMGYFCEVDGSREIVREEQELSTALWVDRNDIPDYKENLSLTHEMMVVFKESRENRD